MSQYCAPKDDDKLHEECGVFGIFSQDEETDVVPLVYYGLFSLQHRGQESAGICAVNKNGLELKKDLGLVGEVFTPETLFKLKGHGAIGHVHYAMSKTTGIENAQPFLSRLRSNSVAARGGA